jgi:hypothetical protein
MILGALVNRMPIALWILAVGPNFTVIHRILHTWKQTKDGRLPLGDSQSTSNAGSSRAKPRVTIPAAVQPRDAAGLLTRAAKRGS